MNLNGHKYDSAGLVASWSAIYLIAERRGGKSKPSATFHPLKWEYWTRKGLRPLCWMNILGGSLVVVMDKRTAEESKLDILWERLGIK